VKIVPCVPEPPAPEAEARLLRSRAAELARDQAELAPDDEGVPVAVLPVGEDVYAIPLEHLRAAIPLATVTPIPLAPPHVIGIVRFRGQAVTVLSFAALFGVGGWRVDPAVLVVLEGPGGRLIAVDCELIPRAATLPRAAIAMARGAQGSRTGPVRELAHPDLGRVLLLEDLGALFGALPGSEGRRSDGRSSDGRRRPDRRGEGD
jgi:chemotaxis signal transduction protein